LLYLYKVFVKRKENYFFIINHNYLMEMKTFI
jgi:hypothetical protein